MKTKLILILILSIALVFVSCEKTDQLIQSTSDLENKELNKKQNPSREESESIIFTGDLEGNQKVEGCCPNAGPFPEYTMTLSGNFPDEIKGEQTGNIFMNEFGRKSDWDYIVQFWWGEETGSNYFTEIRGGEKQYNKRTKILTVTFTDEQMTIIDPEGNSTSVNVNFTLTRVPVK